MTTSVLPDLPTTEDHLDFEASAATGHRVPGIEQNGTRQKQRKDAKTQRRKGAILSVLSIQDPA